MPVLCRPRRTRLARWALALFAANAVGQVSGTASPAPPASSPDAAAQTTTTAAQTATSAAKSQIAAQAGSPTRSVRLSGTVTDPSGAAVPNATVVLQPADGSANIATTTGPTGRYVLLAPAAPGYLLIVSAAQFVTAESDPIVLVAGKPFRLDFKLKIDAAAVEITVSGQDAPPDPSKDGTTLTLKGSAIDQLPLDPTQLSQTIQGLAGGLSPEIYVDGFSNGTLPPRDTIREIRINQNPYSAQNDVNPVNGRVEVFTKPGSAHYSLDVASNGNQNALNSTNPIIGPQPPYYAYFAFANLSGPLGKHSSFFVSGNHSTQQSNSVVDAQVPDPTNTTAVRQLQSVPTPSSSDFLNVRVDHAFGSKSTVVARYILNLSSQTGGGIGALVLPSEGFNTSSTIQTFQLSNSQVLSPHIVNDTRFQYIRSRVVQSPLSSAPTVLVQSSFSGGGSNAGRFNDNTDRYELQNYMMLAEGKHYITTGGRLRVNRDANSSTANYNGTYTFASLTAYEATLNGTAGGGASQFSIQTGAPGVAVAVEDTGLFVQDDWKLRPNFTLSSGLRFETQDAISNHADWAPRLAFAWNLGVSKGKPPHYVLRGGTGIFFQRLGTPQVLQATRQNGTRQQSFVLSNPGFFYPGATPASVLGMLGTATPSSVYTISPHFHAPYGVNSTVGLERRLGTLGSITATYLNVRTLHALLTRNVNAPLPGTYNPMVATSGTRPLGTQQDVDQFSSEGEGWNNRFTVNTYINVPKLDLYLFGNYNLRADRSDTTGGFPTNQYDIRQDYGRATTDTRNQMVLGCGSDLPFGFSFFLFLTARSATPFNITLGQDLNGDSVFNDRPAFATDLSRPSVVRTAYGNFDTIPVAGERMVPINYGNAPAFAQVNFAFGRQFHFGPEIRQPGAPAPAPPPAKPGTKAKKVEIPRRYLLDFRVESENVFNHVSLGPPVSVLPTPVDASTGLVVSSASPSLFGQFNTLLGAESNSANRTVNLTAFFHF